MVAALKQIGLVLSISKLEINSLRLLQKINFVNALIPIYRGQDFHLAATY